MQETKLSRAATRVEQVLAEHGFGGRVRQLPASARTAADAAQAIGCNVAQIAKSLVFKCELSAQPVLVIASGVNQVDMHRLAAVCGEATSKADADFVRAATGFAIGGIPPLGHRADLPTYIDADLLEFDEIWAAAGTPHAVFPLKPAALIELTAGRVVTIKAGAG